MRTIIPDRQEGNSPDAILDPQAMHASLDLSMSDQSKVASSAFGDAAEEGASRGK